MSDRFIFELPLETDPHDERTLHTRFNAGGNLYNACLSEMLKRLQRARESILWGVASSLPKSKKRSELFRNALKKVEFSEYALHFHVKTITRSCWIGDHLDSQAAQAIATRAFQAVEAYCKRKKGRPRFKSVARFCSIAGKSNVTGIRFKDGIIHWMGLALKPRYDRKDRDGVEAHALSHHTKYVRLIRRKMKGSYRFFAQLVQEGKPLVKRKHAIAHGKKVGLDLGPSSIAIVSEKYASLRPFCQELHNKETKINKLSKYLERSRRAMNPSNYTIRGNPLRGVDWKKSNRYQKKQEELSEVMRVLAATRKTLQGKLCNEILSHGATIKTEKLSYKSFQRNYGRSVLRRAPGMLIAILRRKAENAGGQVIEFSTYRTKLSQTCHACTNQKKKPLQERMHHCACGVGPVQRDLYTSFLSLHVEDDCLDRIQACVAWTSAESLLQQALSKCNETANGEQRLASFGLAQYAQIQRQRSSPVQDGSVSSEVRDVVQGNNLPLESFEELDCLAIRTPLL